MGYAIQTVTALPFRELIGGPMNAAVQAQTLAAKSTIEFIKEVGFKVIQEPAPGTEDFENLLALQDAKADPDFGDVRNVTFQYEVEDQEGLSKKVSLTVPILTIVPIPFLRIDEMTIDFMAKITEVMTQKYTSTSESAYSHNLAIGFRSWWSPVSVSFNSSYSSRQSSSAANASRYSSEMTMNVHVRAVQDDIPAGLSRVLNMLEASIKEKPVTTTE